MGTNDQRINPANIFISLFPQRMSDSFQSLRVNPASPHESKARRTRPCETIKQITHGFLCYPSSPLHPISNASTFSGYFSETLCSFQSLGFPIRRFSFRGSRPWFISLESTSSTSFFFFFSLHLMQAYKQASREPNYRLDSKWVSIIPNLP